MKAGRNKEALDLDIFCVDSQSAALKRGNDTQTAGKYTLPTLGHPRQWFLIDVVDNLPRTKVSLPFRRRQLPTARACTRVGQVSWSRP